jgi:hypothetical protein
MCLCQEVWLNRQKGFERAKRLAYVPAGPWHLDVKDCPGIAWVASATDYSAAELSRPRSPKQRVRLW